jgi:hypothetical protein
MSQNEKQQQTQASTQSRGTYTAQHGTESSSEEQPPVYEEAALLLKKPVPSMPVLAVPVLQPRHETIHNGRLVIPFNHSVVMRCPECRTDITTLVKMEPSGFTYGISAVMCLIGAVPFCCLPFCIPACNKTVHECPGCGLKLAYSSL